ncbi:MAG TPA: hypothetical protein VMT34_12735, partial [Aggregatilineales bacterium]|nr:hypothetical protein [Aggregatilineales bacterium]
TAVTITPPLDADRVQVKGPDGTITPLKLDPAGAAPLVFSGTDRPGIYLVDTYRGDTLIQESPFAVNLFAPEESDITVRVPSFASTSPTATDKSEVGQREFWPWVALAALLVLMLEWAVHYRRATGQAIFRFPVRVSTRR